jgi:hypothetical protein
MLSPAVVGRAQCAGLSCRRHDGGDNYHPGADKVQTGMCLCLLSSGSPAGHVMSSSTGGSSGAGADAATEDAAGICAAGSGAAAAAAAAVAAEFVDAGLGAAAAGASAAGGTEATSTAGSPPCTAGCCAGCCAGPPGPSAGTGVAAAGAGPSTLLLLADGSAGCTAGALGPAAHCSRCCRGGCTSRRSSLLLSLLTERWRLEGPWSPGARLGTGLRCLRRPAPRKGLDASCRL